MKLKRIVIEEDDEATPSVEGRQQRPPEISMGRDEIGGQAVHRELRHSSSNYRQPGGISDGRNENGETMADQVTFSGGNPNPWFLPVQDRLPQERQFEQGWRGRYQWHQSAAAITYDAYVLKSKLWKATGRARPHKDSTGGKTSSEMRPLVNIGSGESYEVVSEGKEKKPDPAPAPATPPPAKKPLTAAGDSLAKILLDSGSAYTKTVIGNHSIRTRIAQKMDGVEVFIFHQDDSSRNADLVFVVAELFEPFLVIGMENVTRGQFVMTWDLGGFVRINVYFFFRLKRLCNQKAVGIGMACFGSKVIQSRRTNPHNLVDTSQMAGEDNLSESTGMKKHKNRRPRKEHHGADKDHCQENLSGRQHKKNGKVQKLLKLHNASEPPKTVLRKRVDPETAKYFSESANLFEGGGLEVDERSVICGNALEESRGKELELATYTILSHTLQTLLEGCDVDHLCNFLLSCAEDFTLIAMDKSGSHVAETALKSLALYLKDVEVFTTIEETVTKICEVVAERSADVMSDCYGSHVIRSLLCLCKGVGFESLEEFHVTKSAITLAERLNSGLPKSGGNHLPNSHPGFPHLLKFLVRGMLQHSKESLKDLCVNKYSSLVLQVSLKLLAGNDQELMHVIPLLLGYRKESNAKGKFVEIFTIDGNNDLIQDTAYSHLMEELGPRIKELLETGKSGGVASLLAACQRLHMHEHDCCRTVDAAVHSGSESARCIVPRILFFDSYFRCEERSCWKWATAEKMHTLGCLMLQTIFRYTREFIHPYLMRITSMEAACLFETAKDAGGGRGIESFLCSEASVKQKCKVITQLRCRFGRLSMHPSGSFTVEKCFTAANLSLREVIASALSASQPELSRTKHGPYLLKKLDIDGYAARPDQWKSRQASKQNAYKEFVDVFGSETKSQKKSISSERHCTRFPPSTSIHS